MQGQINIQYQPYAIASVRPFEIQKLCLHRTPEQVIQFIGLAYSLCGKAQQFAAQLALQDLTEEQLQQSAHHVSLENLKEHFIHLTQLLYTFELISEAERSHHLQGVGNWPQQKSNKADSLTICQRIHEKFSTLLPGFDLVKMSVQQIISLPKIKQLFQKIVPIQLAEPLPNIHQQHNIEAHMFSPKSWDMWVTTPALNTAIENTAFSRSHAYTAEFQSLNIAELQKRVLGKLLDAMANFKTLSNQTDKSSPPLFGFKKQDNITVSWVESARGRLFHLAEIDPQTQTTRRYAISAPTEWNFHPKGIVHQLIQALPQAEFSHWQKQVQQIAQIIDPCVPFHIHKGQA